MAGLRERRVIVVDDNRDAADTVATLLRQIGQDVQQAYDGDSALKLAERFRPDVVLLDLVMPGVDGLAVARRLRDMEGLKNTRIIALTAFAQPAFVAATTSAGFDGHLLKPASATELMRILSY